ncbi:hypothetical protein GN958_ATG15964 [Phytophthora infestans]|uniref:WLGC domain-containing protein n=1 Tax=Phytophthora infestans TaxID=4787 RepID=A0A8S9U8X4_PHYIN|nr:hypothetical protein GN958_ATG15964 [Phytophthora infestans]
METLLLRHLLQSRIYCYYNFDVDRQVYSTYFKPLRPGGFERLARNFAHPSEVALSRTDFAVRIGLNLTFCYRLERVFEAFVWTRYRSRGAENIVTPTQNSVPKGVTGVVVLFAVAILVATLRIPHNSAPFTRSVYCLCCDGSLAANTARVSFSLTLIMHPEHIKNELTRSTRTTRRRLWQLLLTYTSTERIPECAKELRNFINKNLVNPTWRTYLPQLPTDNNSAWHSPKITSLALLTGAPPCLFTPITQFRQRSQFEQLMEEMVIYRPNYVRSSCLKNDTNSGYLFTSCRGSITKRVQQICLDYLSRFLDRFRQCRFPLNRTGICYNARFQVLSCFSDENYIALHRLETAKGVGPKYDPVEEKWLGCNG